MRMSCNGCRILRKGCSESCSIRPCLRWLRNPEEQANATLFLAKFYGYGRAGLMSLITSAPEQLRPAIFRSLMYEACGRIVNPIQGSVGLLSSGNWHVCEAAVESVLKGSPITTNPNFRTYDIRHVPREPGPPAGPSKVVKNRARFRRSVSQTGSGSGLGSVELEGSNVTEAEDEVRLDLELGLGPPGARAG
ncbi:uncharacterized protein A4U43_C06F7040 [Asparagus officinalis]|uniref:LOB domain-containing protein n=1 Tax=Asparagus officinalis TaxID=4686 RepID=A0A5P1EK49_ASPOF|nr:LOB domain-containing protein 40-like [Asparagus officinalis]ONK66368.1 uncharacterized protein A4U43_C06F7040 [Asparagus officinalis]